MIDVVIVNWNAGEQLRNCVESVRAFHDGLLGKCIVVDNGSTDGSMDFIKNAPDVDLILAGQNLGFAKACNLGAKRAGSDYLLFLNPDAALFEGTLAKVVNFMQEPANEAVAICGVQLIEDNGQVARSCARLPSVSGILAHAVGLNRVLPSLGHPMDEWDHLTNRPVDQVIGAFFFIRRGLFEQLQGFDERFFVYFEEVDLSYRATQLGYRSVYLADVQAFHKGGGVSDQVKAHRLFYSLRSRILYAFKHFNMPAAVLVMATTLIVEPVSRLMFLLIRGRGGEIRDLGRGYQMLWGWVLAQSRRGRVSG